MKTVTFKGSKGESHYHGYDGDTPVRLDAGDSAEVSDEKATQLAADFPSLFLIGGKKPTKLAAVPPAPAEDDDENDEDEPDDAGAGDESDEDRAALLDLPVVDLAARATKLGIEGVGKKGCRTKPELADAIIAKLAETAAE